MIFKLLLCLNVILLVGCGERVNVTRAAMGADQEMDAIQQTVTAEAEKPPGDRDFAAFARELSDRISYARRFMSPVVRFLDAGDGTHTETDSHMALVDHEQFKQLSAPVIAAANVEAEDETNGHQLWQQTKSYLGQVVGGGLSAYLTGTGVGGLALSALALLRSNSRIKTALGKAVEYGVAITNVAAEKAPVETEKIKDDCKADQVAAGVHTIIKNTMAKTV